jgi:hypothetical protein
MTSTLPVTDGSKQIMDHLAFFGCNMHRKLLSSLAVRYDFQQMVT